MKPPSLYHHLLVLLIASVWTTVIGYSGPVYVNPAAESSSQVAVVAQSAPAASFLTQTVYGFLDFTTTIGNTVMVFSPQSAPAAEPPKKPAPTKPTIETKPPSSAQSFSTSEISPSPATSPKSESSKQIVSSKQAVVSSKSSPVPNKPLAVSSVVEVRVSTAVPQPAAPSVVTFFSSVVEVRSSENGPSGPPPPEPAGPSNNLLAGGEIYDFLSKQPGQVVDETYKVYDLKPSNAKGIKSSRAASKELPLQRVKGSAHPTGLISSMGGTVVRDGVTTVHETLVSGTIIDGKYSQVTQSTSIIKQQLVINPTKSSAPRIILKTHAPPQQAAPNSKLHHLEPTPSGSNAGEETVFFDEDVLTTRPLRRSAVAGRSEFLSRLQRTRLPSLSVEQHDSEYEDDLEVSPRITPSNTKKVSSSRARTLQPSSRPAFSSRFTNSKYGRSTSELATVSVFTEPPRSYSTASVAPAAGRRYTSYNRNRSGGNNNSKESTTRSNNGPSASGGGGSSENGYTRRGYKPRNSETLSNHGNTNNQHNPTSAPAPSLNKFKLTRPAGRWQYKTSPKPRVTIRQQQQRPSDGVGTDVTPADNELNALTPPASHAALTSPQPGREHDSNEETGGGPSTESLLASGGELQAEGAEDHPHHVATDALPTPTAETIKVQISTPVDFSDVYFEIATIRSPYTFQVGTLKNTRFITVTSTYEKNLATNHESEISPTEPLTENILATSTSPPFEVNQLPVDASVATLPAILLATDVETPPLETVTETFNTTQLLLKTHVLPVVQQGNIPTTKMYTLVQSYHVTRFVTAVKTLPPADAFQFLPSRSLNEFNSRLDEAGSELHELELSENDQDGEGEERRLFPPDLMGIGDLASIGGDFDVEKLQKQTAISPSTTASSKREASSSTAQLSPEQLQQLALLRYLNPLAPVPAITTSKPIIKMETVYESHVIPLFNGLSTVYSTISRPIATISKTEYEVQTVVPSTPPIPGFGPQFTLTSTPVVTQTIATLTESKILKLTFGAKTLYSTLYSTQVVPTVVTTYVTTQVPVLPTVPAFPGFFPGAFPPFPYVG